MTVATLCDWLQQLAPLELSEDWDNTGLLLGDPAAAVERVMTCLTLTPASVAEALAEGAQMVVVHHPLPFKPLAKITTQSYSGRLVWELARAGISVYSPHTAWDSAPRGINARLADMLGLTQVAPLIPADPVRWPNLSVNVGAGRSGVLPQPLTISEITDILAQQLPSCRPRVSEPERIGTAEMDGPEAEPPRLVRKVAICCGSGGSLLSAAVASHCDLFLTGEGTFHTCLESQAAGIALLMIGHFASERFAMEQLATELSAAHPQVAVWASKLEGDPVRNCEVRSIHP